MVKIFNGSFKKKNDEVRTMTFVKLEDLPTTFLETKIGSKAKPRLLPPGQELVWDLEQSGLRTFNWKTAVGDIGVKLLEGQEKKEFETKHLTEQK